MPREPPVMRTVCAMSDGNRLLCLEQTLVQILALCQTLLNVDIGNNVVIRNNNAVGLALHQSTNCSVAHAGRHNTIHSRRRAAALDVTEDRYTGVNAGSLVDLVCDLLCRAVALCYDDDMVVAALDTADAHSLYDLGVEIQLTLGQADRGRADCTANLQCQMTCTAAHNLYNRAALVGLHGVAQLIDAFDRRIAGGVKTDGVIRAADIIINGTRNADARNTLAGKQIRPSMPR